MGQLDAVRRCVEQDGANVNFAGGPAVSQSPLLAALSHHVIALYLLSRGADPRWKDEAGTSALCRVSESISYSFFADNSNLVELYLAMTKSLDNAASERLLVNLRARQPLGHMSSREPSEDYFTLLKHPLVVADSWAEVLKTCGVKDAKLKQVLTNACQAQAPMLQHALWAHPRVVAAILSLPGGKPTKSMIKDAKGAGKDTTLLEAADETEREAALKRLLAALEAKKGPAAT